MCVGAEPFFQIDTISCIDMKTLRGAARMKHVYYLYFIFEIHSALVFNCVNKSSENTREPFTSKKPQIKSGKSYFGCSLPLQFLTLKQKH